jgi:hypothetical protein
VFWPLNSSSEFSGVLEDSNFPLLGVWVSSSHLSQNGVATLKLRLFWFWRPIIMCVDLWLRWGLKQSCSPSQDLFNDMWHATHKQGNQGDSQLLVVGNQIGNLTLGSSFGHNLYFKCRNGSCEPIFYIYVTKTFQKYNEFFSPMNFDPLQSPSENLRIHRDSNSWSGSSLGSVGVHSLTFSYILESMKCDSRASLLAHTFANLCLGCEPKVRVVTKHSTCVYKAPTSFTNLTNWTLLPQNPWTSASWEVPYYNFILFLVWILVKQNLINLSISRRGNFQW